MLPMDQFHVYLIGLYRLAIWVLFGNIFIVSVLYLDTNWLLGYQIILIILLFKTSSNYCISPSDGGCRRGRTGDAQRSPREGHQ